MVKMSNFTDDRLISKVLYYGKRMTEKINLENFARSWVLRGRKKFWKFVWIYFFYLKKKEQSQDKIYTRKNGYCHCGSSKIMGKGFAFNLAVRNLSVYGGLILPIMMKHDPWPAKYNISRSIWYGTNEIFELIAYAAKPAKQFWQKEIVNRLLISRPWMWFLLSKLWIGRW